MAPTPPACAIFGHVWVVLSWKEDLDPAEMERRGKGIPGPVSAVTLEPTFRISQSR